MEVLSVQSRSATHAKGIDVSHWQGIIDWKKVRGAGYSFAFLKATEGSRIVDDRFRANAQDAKNAGLLVGAYHFTRAASPDDVKNEVDHFLQVIESAGGLSAFKLPFVLDIETKEGQTKARISQIVNTWGTQFKQRTGRTLMIYTFPSFIDSYLDSSLGSYPLWYAYYSSGTPANKAGWKAWEFIQYTNKGKVPGISGDVDLNEYKGSEAELMAAYSNPTPNTSETAPQWKESGRQWLIDQVGISSDWKAEDPVDIGTLGSILLKYTQNVLGKKQS
nr:glycoside hydrolase family 25 protein [Paenibacillus cellulositrophicus]